MSRVEACLMAGWVQVANRGGGPISVAVVIRPPGQVPLTVSMAQAAMSGTDPDFAVPARRRPQRRPGRQFPRLTARPVVALPSAGFAC